MSKFQRRVALPDPKLPVSVSQKEVSHHTVMCRRCVRFHKTRHGTKVPWHPNEGRHGFAAAY